ncbi:UDP-N-acetylglucosamine 4,6-dehydratase (inverting) [Legionella pneumophila subsp. fraseri]|nr:UDP-N-acetylglucosamine 4,6-dehydratase (inverting) [Legionella pneumophila]MDW8879100.1 UDP-N-acetylglucosamine 4,6-dehydratase (inverting) [Legionella pneumophila subsp. fraseri]MDW8961578.1 UDP-N-acetylglucosamine 4,6-dehydratase (inverting) [Legionella pneumophila subsp. fraseri]HAT1798059.1 UDP-N-acetylglucosamine 4,6-dehydratase (inverting) [Legionella pneumophila]HAT1847422.1 UDP-N-acetylglucosamine 4,6-dehydratase (inverting) [Legionella pneumophila]HAT1862708.1 UDP-N-acetylglucosam
MIKNFFSHVPDLNQKTILITGGTGSFGVVFLKRIIERFSPKKLIIFSRDELKQYELAMQFPEKKYPFIRYFIGDVRDYNRLEMAFRDVDIVVHAAALKHVSIAEYNPYECIHTNVIGAENIVRAALRNQVKKVIALSTDKAVNPINLYGASKLAAEKIFVAANNIRGCDPTIFSVVRYGNVIGSRGSVLPLFRKLIQEGVKSLPITDPRMTRFWITLPQSVDFVLSSIAMMQGGEIFIPKIPSMKIIDIAQWFSSDIDTHTIGIRPGEKLHEWLLTGDESSQTIELPDRYIIEPFCEGPYKSNEQNPRVTKGYIYSSETNSEWIEQSQFQEWLNG